MTSISAIASLEDHAETGAEPVERSALTDRDFKRALADVAPHLRAFARGLCGCRDRADDLAQEAMLRAWAARDRYAAGTNFKAWTFTILRNHFYSEARRARFHGEYDEVAAERILRAPAGQEGAIELADVLRALSAIPASYREALILVAAGNLSYEEIADICGIALGTVKSRICRARAMLSQVIESGQLPDFRHNFVLGGDAIDAFFAELGKIANLHPEELRLAAMAQAA
ncbi:sigma-70 family RNA polymerase sigma factor [Novosphingobium colocasiae]|uniref:DNA-directed RNA polymerase sigma-70 factor n=1 Tax=Novosphingobium colocasiae TaxID=1256513 RepID=A0A918UE39_9SPHN|nr:sigma-70 family RNA polymerase sigma factor [Novosphingobium colocasiae]GGY94228.1 DNA-directed RNA polymerase sigma-70 factor [Novosphingobium colocasiae]